MKRSFDIVISFLAMVVALPFMIPVMIILKLTGEHYVFYRQARVGQHGKSFRMYKFSTMLLKSPELLSGDITLRKDPRVLPFGRFLRITKINEIPQLINVFKGD
ncbi:MAG: sugar transferase, partial [Bacteroidales bacterium]